MRTKGIIRIVAVPNPILLGYRAWAKIGIKVIPGFLEQVARELASHTSVYFVAYAIGTFDIISAVRFHTTEGLSHFVNVTLPRITGVQNTETMILMCPRKYYHFSWPAPTFKKLDHADEYYIDTAATYPQYDVDGVDRKILNILMDDGLTRPATIKSKLGMGESTIRKRIKSLSRNEVFRIEVVPNMDILQYEAWATIGIIVNQQSVHKVLDNIIKNHSVYLASSSIGRFNVIIAARFHNTDLLNQFVKLELPLIQGVGSVDIFLHSKPLKYHNINWFP